MLWILLAPTVVYAAEPTLHLSIAKRSRTDAEAVVSVPDALEATVVEGERSRWTVLAYPTDHEGTDGVCFGVVKGEADVDATPRLSACLQLIDGQAMSTQTTRGPLSVDAELSWTERDG